MERVPTVMLEMRALLRLAGPTVVQTASQQAMVFTDQIFLGHLGTEEMAAAALGNMWAAFLSFFLFGTATALDTLGSQAYGAEKKGIKGTSLVTWCFTSFVVLNVLCIPTSVGLGLGKPFAKSALGQDEEIGHLVGEFCVGLIPGIWPLMWSTVLMKYLQVQNVMTAPAVITGITFFLNIAFNFLFIYGFGLGFKGAPWATSFSRFVQFVALAILVYFFNHTKGRRSRVANFLFEGADEGEHTLSDTLEHEPASQHRPLEGGGHSGGYAPLMLELPAVAASFIGSTGETSHSSLLVSGPHAAVAGQGQRASKVARAEAEEEVRDHLSMGQMAGFIWSQSRAAMHPSLLWAYLKLGLPGGVMMSCEQGAFDVTTAFAGRLGPAVVAAHSALLNIVGLTFVSCPFAVGIAGSIRVGNLLGGGKPLTARMSGWLCVAVGGGFMLTCACVILIFRNSLGFIFTNDLQVVGIIASLAPMCAMFQISDGVMGTAQGVLRGCGRQHQLMLFNLLGFWVGGVLLGYFLCFHAGMGVAGLWWGIACGDTCVALMNVVTLALVRWPKEAVKAHKQMEDMQAKLEGSSANQDDTAPDQDGDEESAEQASLLPHKHQSSARQQSSTERQPSVHHTHAADLGSGFAEGRQSLPTQFGSSPPVAVLVIGGGLDAAPVKL